MATKTEQTQTKSGTEIQAELAKFGSNKSAQIRYLTGLGYKPGQIVKLSKSIPSLQYDDGRELRPQHVYGVLKTPLIGK